MALLDTFFIMFEADTSKLEKGMKDADKSSKDLTATLSDTDSISKVLTESFNKMVIELGAIAVAGLSAQKIISEFNEAISFSDKLGKMSNAIDVNIKDIGAWGEAVKINGGSAEGFQGTIKSITNDLGQLGMAGVSSTLPFFARLGINIFGANGQIRNAIDLLPELAGKFEKMSNQKAMTFGKNLGLDEGTIMLLQKGRKAVEEQVEKMKSLDGITKENAKASASFQKAMDEVNFALRGANLEISTSILPVMTWFMEKIESIIQFFRENKEFAEGFFIAIGSAIAFFLVPPLITASVALWALIAPFVAVGAAVVAVAAVFALLYDDITNFMDGNDSLIGQISEKYPIVGETVKDLASAFTFLKNVVGSVLGFLVDALFAPSKAFDNFFNNIGVSIDGLRDRFKELFSFFDDMKDKVENNPLMKGAKNAWAGTMEFLGVDSDKKEEKKEIAKEAPIPKDILGLQNVIIPAKEQIASANSAPINQMSSNAISNMRGDTNANIQIDKIEVQTQATDAEGMALHVGNALQDHLQTAAMQFSDGIQ